MTERKRIVSFGSNGGSFAPTAWWTIRNGAELVGDGFPFVITSDALERLVGEHEEIGIGETIEATREFIVRRVIGTSLGAQRMILFPIRIDYPEDEAGIRWDKDIAHGHIAHTLRSLASATTDPISELSDDSIRRQVADVVLVSIERLAEHIPQHRIDEGERDGMLERDAALADELEQIGQHGRERAALVRESAKRRFANRDDLLAYFSLWLPDGFLESEFVDGLPWIRALGRAAWFDVVLPKLERESRVRPALAYQIHEDVSRIHSRTHTLETRNGQQHLRFDGHSPIAIVPSVEDDALGRIAESIVRGVSLLGNITAHKALQWEVFTGYRQAIEGAADARVLLVEGGWSAFARDVLDLSAKSDIENVRDIVRAQSAIRLSLPDGSFGNLLALREMEARGRRRGWIEIVLGTMLMPHYVHELDGKLSGRTASESKRLVPMVGLPPFVGSRTEHGAQATLSMHVVRELRTRAPELVTDGGVLIDAGRFASLAMSSGVKASNVHRVIDRWTQDGTDAPAFLRRVGHSRYTLGDAHAPARSFLETAGKMTIDASAAGRKSIEAKAKARTGLRRRGKRAAE